VRRTVGGILFTGGGDIDPEIYNGLPHETVDDIDSDRDAQELFLARRVIETHTPTFGICRGLQILNVAHGGTLHTHIMDQLPGAIRHDYWPQFPRGHTAHPVRIEEGTALAGILDTPILHVNSLHHQGVRNLGAGLTPSAYAPDGLIEAFELDDHPFGIAVQWHPEWLNGDHRAARLFEAFAAAAANRHA
jgi:putative glutamine amidotransferase